MDRLDLIRKRAAADAYDGEAARDVQYLLAVIDTIARLWEAQELAKIDPDND